MYVFALIALVSGTVWLVIERPSTTLGRKAAQFGAISYGVFAILTGAFWVFWPASTAQLVPGHAGGILVATATQARGIVGIALGIIALATRNHRPASTRSILMGPLLYNLIMSLEALAAQFSVLATPERWLYVALHFSWAVGFGSRFLTRGAVESNEVAYRFKPLFLAAMAGLLVLAGCALFMMPYGSMGRSMPATASAFLAHSLHGFGSACVALGAVIFIVGTGKPDDTPSAMVAVVALGSAGLAILAVMSTDELGPWQAYVRLGALMCLLTGSVLYFTLRDRRSMIPPVQGDAS